MADAILGEWLTPPQLASRVGWNRRRMLRMLRSLDRRHGSVLVNVSNGEVEARWMVSTARLRDVSPELFGGAPPAMVEKRPALPLSTSGAGGVYFIQGEQGGLVKIGFSEAPQKRLKDLQVGSPSMLRILAVLRAEVPDAERHVHSQFSDIREHGEWFRPTAELMIFIASIHGSQRA